MFSRWEVVPNHITKELCPDQVHQVRDTSSFPQHTVSTPPPGSVRRCHGGSQSEGTPSPTLVIPGKAGQVPHEENKVCGKHKGVRVEERPFGPRSPGGAETRRGFQAEGNKQREQRCRGREEAVCGGDLDSRFGCRATCRDKQKVGEMPEKGLQGLDRAQEDLGGHPLHFLS